MLIGLMRCPLVLLSLLIAAWVPVTEGAEAEPQKDVLETAFTSPDSAARPHTFWHWINGSISKEGITKDLEAMKQVGIGGVDLYDISPGPKGPVRFLSPEWRSMVSHAIAECDRLGLEFAMHNEGGWTVSGGSWVEPKDSMKVVVSSEMRVDGGHALTVKLPQPQKNLGFYKDSAVIAFPSPKDDVQITLDDIAEVRSNLPGVTKEALFDNDPQTQVVLTPSVGAERGYIDVVFKEPQTIQSITLRPAIDKMGGDGHTEATLSISASATDTGSAFTPLLTSEGRWSLDKPFFRVRNRPCYAAIKPVTAKVLRFNLVSASGNTGNSLPLSDVSLSKAFRIPMLPVLTNMQHYWSGSGLDFPMQGLTEQAAINPADILDLTAKMDPDGTLKWDAPPGKWTILRVGYTATGMGNSSARESGSGLEVDKLSSESVDNFWAGYMGKVVSDNKAQLGKGFRGVELDNYESTSQNWTDRFPEEFKNRRGYSILSHLPVLAGYVVDNMEESLRFLWDFRRTISETFVERYSGHLAELAHQNGLILMNECYHSPVDQFEYGGTSDMPMGEIWMRYGRMTQEPERSVPCKMAACVSHVYGKKITGAEAFTSTEWESQWDDNPFSYKSLGDYTFTLGVNRLQFHRFTHQPFENIKPGLVMDHWGCYMDRNNTWWPYASAYMEYLARCQALLQRGTFFADLIYYTGESTPLREIVPQTMLKPGVPQGYDYGMVSRGGLLQKAAVKDGMLDFSGSRYRLLVLPGTERMSLEVLRKVAELVKAGATVYGQKPKSSPSLAGQPGTDRDLATLAEEVWGDCDGKSIFEHSYGKGRVVFGVPLEKALGVGPDFSYIGNPQTELNFIHRKLGEADFYFVANRDMITSQMELSFRVKGMQPEIWFPDTGKMVELGEFRNTETGITFPLQVDACQSMFVVFRKPQQKGAGAVCEFTPATSRPAQPDVSSQVEIEKATYVIKGDRSIEHDVTARVVGLMQDKQFILDGQLTLPVDAGSMLVNDPSPGIRSLEVVYRLDGERFKTRVAQYSAALLKIGPVRPLIEPAPCRVDHGAEGLKALVSQSGTLKFKEDGKPESKIAVTVPQPLVLENPWSVQFGELGPKTPLVFNTLQSWHLNENQDIRYYSGSAIYSTTFEVPKGWVDSGSVSLLDLGRVYDIASIKVNGKEAGITWKPPYRVDVSSLLKAGTNTLEVSVANVWVNRLIGDEQFPIDYKFVSPTPEHRIVNEWPEWVLEGKPRPEPRRKTFTTFSFYQADSPLRPAGLLGPVRLMQLKEIPLK
jgi:hypothetical protein